MSLDPSRIEKLGEAFLDQPTSAEDSRPSLPSDTARTFRLRLFQPAYDYYRARMPALLTAEFGLTDQEAFATSTALAFRPPLRLDAASQNTITNRDLAYRSRLEQDHRSLILELERYFTYRVHLELGRPLSAPTVHYAARSVADLHSIFGLLGNGSRNPAFAEESFDDHHPVQEEDALRLLLQALQVVEILRAQQAIVDGSSLVEILWADLQSGVSERWSRARAVLNSSSLIRNNFGRYAIYRSVTGNMETSTTAYSVLLSSGNLRQLEIFLDRAFGEGIVVTLTCDSEPSLPESDCLDIAGNRYLTNMEASLRWPGSVADSEALVTFELPGWQVLASGAFERSDAFLATQDLHDRLRREAAGYQMRTRLAAALPNGEYGDFVDNLALLYQYSVNLSRGHQRPSLE